MKVVLKVDKVTVERGEECGGDLTFPFQQEKLLLVLKHQVCSLVEGEVQGWSGYPGIERRGGWGEGLVEINIFFRHVCLCVVYSALDCLLAYEQCTEVSSRARLVRDTGNASPSSLFHPCQGPRELFWILQPPTGVQQCSSQARDAVFLERPLCGYEHMQGGSGLIICRRGWNEQVAMEHHGNARTLGQHLQRQICSLIDKFLT